jgi:hypothetical protein
MSGDKGREIAKLDLMNSLTLIGEKIFILVGVLQNRAGFMLLKMRELSA